MDDKTKIEKLEIENQYLKTEIEVLKHKLEKNKSVLANFASLWLSNFIKELENPNFAWMKEYFIASGDLDKLVKAWEKASGK